MKLNLWIWIIFASALTSCSGPFGSEERDFTSGCWGLNDTITLTFDNQDVEMVRSLYFPLRVDEKFSYNNIFVRLETKTPSGNTSTQQYQFKLMDETGKWLGESSGSETTFNLYAGEKMKLTQKGKYTFRLYHFMRDQSLCGVKKAGVAIGEEKN